MPSYDYICDKNGKTIEVRHSMSVSLKTWGELCEMLGIKAGDTPKNAPVRKLITGGGVMKNENRGSGEAPPCETGGPCCGGRMCEM